MNRMINLVTIYLQCQVVTLQNVCVGVIHENVQQIIISFCECNQSYFSYILANKCLNNKEAVMQNVVRKLDSFDHHICQEDYG